MGWVGGDLLRAISRLRLASAVEALSPHQLVQVCWHHRLVDALHSLEVPLHPRPVRRRCHDGKTCEKWRMRTGGKARGLWNSSRVRISSWEAKKTGKERQTRAPEIPMEAEGTSGGKTEVPFSEKQITAIAGVVQIRLSPSRGPREKEAARQRTGR